VQPVADNRTLVRRYFEEVLNRGDFAVADALLSADIVFRNPPIVARGTSEFKRAIGDVRAAFPDLRFEIEDELVDGDKVATRWRVMGTQRGAFFGHPASGKRIDVTGMNIFRIAGGRIHEIWVNMDRWGEAEQLGWIAPPQR
jgi:steroid delta-isomerase-like uncharacterized protein